MTNPSILPPEDLPRPKEQATASSEADALAHQQDLARKSLTFAAEQAARRLIDLGMRSLMVVIFFSLIAAVFIFSWHMLAPESLKWLLPEDVLVLKSFIFSGAVLGAASNFFRKYT